MSKRSKSPFDDLASEYPVSAGDAELEQGPYEDGFSSRTVVGALFVALIMMPGSIYLGLVAGQQLGPAAEWVTIILFAEMARRSFAHLKRQEVFILFYVASSIAAVTLMHLALSGGPFAMTIWNQYLLQSPETSAIAGQLPDWVVPPIDSPAIQQRDLSHVDWWWSGSKGVLSPMLLIVIGYVLGRMAWIGLGYVLFRLLSDIERLPFPLAPIAAAGATALAESTDRDESGRGKRSWRWNVFGVGACLGIVFGSLYVLLPMVTGLFMTKPIMLFPIPFVDFTRSVEGFLPASLISISFDAALLLAGMILPFRMVLGTFTAIILTSVIGNPILYKLGAFEHYTPGYGLLVNQMILSFDFWMSVALGMAGAVALVGIWNMIVAFRRARQDKTEKEVEKDKDGVVVRGPSRERGDFPIWIALLVFVVAISGFSLVSHLLVPGFPIWIILIFGFIWTPLHSYISARLIGLTGQGLQTPYLKETVFITSGYKGVDIWFAPIPLFDFGGVTMRFRELELTRTKFTSIIKAELLMLPIIFVCSFLFWWFFWKLNQIPSDLFPFAARLWPIAARQSYLIFTANGSETPLLLEALNPVIISGALGVGLSLYLGLGWLGVPVTFFYGMIGGMGAPLHAGLAMLVGALAGRYYFQRKFGREKWSRYLPVVAAGFSCGMGLAGMVGVALSLMANCARELPF